MASLFSGRGGALGSLWGDNTIPQGGVMGEPDRTPMQDARLAFAAQLLAGSGGTQGNFAEIMGKALLASRQARLQTQEFQAQRAAQEQENALRQAQIQQINNPPQQVGSFGTQGTGLYNESTGAVLREPVEPYRADYSGATDRTLFNNFTPDSIAKYYESQTEDNPRGDVSLLVRKPFAPTVYGAGGVPYSSERPGSGAVGTPRQLVDVDETASNAETVAEARAAGSKRGDISSEAAAALPGIESSGNYLISNLTRFKSMPALDTVYGPIAGRTFGTVPLTDAQTAAVALRDQIAGQAFLDSYVALRGGGAGAISDAEGKRFVAARTRLLDQRISADEAIKAADELISLTNSAIAAARSKIRAPKQSSGTAQNDAGWGAAEVVTP